MYCNINDPFLIFIQINWLIEYKKQGIDKVVKRVLESFGDIYILVWVFSM